MRTAHSLLRLVSILLDLAQGARRDGRPTLLDYLWFYSRGFLHGTADRESAPTPQFQSPCYRVIRHVAMFVAGRHFYDRLSPSITASFNEPRRTESKSLLNLESGSYVASISTVACFFDSGLVSGQTSVAILTCIPT